MENFPAKATVIQELLNVFYKLQPLLISTQTFHSFAFIFPSSADAPRSLKKLNSHQQILQHFKPLQNTQHLPCVSTTSSPLNAAANHSPPPLSSPARHPAPGSDVSTPTLTTIVAHSTAAVALSKRREKHQANAPLTATKPGLRRRWGS